MGIFKHLLAKHARARNPQYLAKKGFQREVKRILGRPDPAWLLSAIRKRMDPPDGRWAVGASVLFSREVALAKTIRIGDAARIA